MTMSRLLWLMAGALIAIAGALYLSSQRHLERDPNAQLLLSSLHAELDSITDVTLRKAGSKPSLTLHRAAPGKWTLLERGDYPADLAKVRKLLSALAELKIIEEKTSDPANYAVLNVDDPGAANSSAIEVVLISKAAKTGLIVGRSSGNGSFVRRSGAAQSYLVEPALSVETSVRDWIDAKLLDLPLEKINAIEFKLADGSAYSITRKAGTDAKKAAPLEFALQPVPAGRQPNEPAAIAPSPTSFGELSANDVAAAATIDFSKASHAQIRLLDGSTYTLTGTVLADKHWITVAASKDESLSARVKDRAFEIASYRYDAIFRPLEQLLQPKPVKPTATAVPKKPPR